MIHVSFGIYGDVVKKEFKITAKKMLKVLGICFHLSESGIGTFHVCHWRLSLTRTKLFHQVQIKWVEIESRNKISNMGFFSKKRLAVSVRILVKCQKVFRRRGLIRVLTIITDWKSFTKMKEKQGK